MSRAKTRVRVPFWVFFWESLPKKEVLNLYCIHWTISLILFIDGFKNMADYEIDASHMQRHFFPY